MTWEETHFGIQSLKVPKLLQLTVVTTSESESNSGELRPTGTGRSAKNLKTSAQTGAEEAGLKAAEALRAAGHAKLDDPASRPESELASLPAGRRGGEIGRKLLRLGIALANVIGSRGRGSTTAVG